MKRNRGGERDLDHIIMAAVRGLDRASLEYPQVRAGIILMMDRTFDERQNAVIVEKAIRYASRGIVGVDIAGPRPRAGPLPLPRPRPARAGGARGGPRRDGARGRGGLSREEIGEVVETLAPDRIGHGILAARDPELMALLAERGHRARDLPDLEPADQGAGRRRRGARDLPDLPRRRRARHGLDRRPRDDAHPPARRVRVPLPHRRADAPRRRAPPTRWRTRSSVVSGQALRVERSSRVGASPRLGESDRAAAARRCTAPRGPRGAHGAVRRLVDARPVRGRDRRGAPRRARGAPASSTSRTWDAFDVARRRRARLPAGPALERPRPRSRRARRSTRCSRTSPAASSTT